MKKFLMLALLSLAAISLAGAFFGCGGNSAVGDNDDDDGDDTDDDADDDVGNGGEPLAVISCEKNCADVGEIISFSAEESSDPQGSELEYNFDFGDGNTQEGVTAEHEYETAGAYRVVLTVTNEFGLKDSSSCIVSVGDFPTEVGYINEVEFAKNHYNPLIHEEAPPRDHGGLIYGFFIAPANATPDAIIINGQPARPLLGEVEWCEVIQTELAAGDLGILRCHSYSDNFDPDDPISIVVRDNGATVWSIDTIIPEPSLTPSYITSNTDGTEILVFVRNDSDRKITVTGLSINGNDVSDFAIIDNPNVEPNHLAIIHVPRCDGVPFGEWTAFTVRGTDGKENISVSRALRLFKPMFPIGNWNSGDAFTDPNELDVNLSIKVNMLIWNPLEHSPKLVLPLAEENDFYLFTHFGVTNPAFEEFVNSYKDNPRILTNAVSGEGEFGGVPIEALQKLRHHRELWGSHKPLWIYNACAYQFPSWGALADISGMDHYCVWAPKCNTNFPPGMWDRVEFTGFYAEEIKLAAEPKPTWDWTQAAWTTWEQRCATKDEIRSQWYQVVSRGAKGILWFFVRPYWYEFCPDESIDELLKLANELAPLKNVLLEGDVVTTGIVAYTDMELVDVRATLSPKAIAIFLTNLDYELNLVTPFVWNEKYEVPVYFKPPSWFEPAKFVMLNGEEQVELQAKKINDTTWRFYVPVLVSAESVIVIPEP